MVLGPSLQRVRTGKGVGSVGGGFALSFKELKNQTKEKKRKTKKRGYFVFGDKFLEKERRLGLVLSVVLADWGWSVGVGRGEPHFLSRNWGARVLLV